MTKGARNRTKRSIDAIFWKEPPDMPTLIPTYALYGEYLEESREDVLHYERLHDRSAKHDWSIRPHKHDTMWQFCHFHDGDVRMQLEREVVQTSGPVFVCVPPLSIHAFQFPPNALGSVVSARIPVVASLLDAIPEGGALSERPLVISQHSSEFGALCHSANNIQTGFGKIDLQRNQYLEACLTTLLIAMTRHVLSTRTNHQIHALPRDDVLLRRFCNLIEENFQGNWSSTDYATELGISTVSLNRKCRLTLVHPLNGF